MRKLTENAARARRVLERAGAPLAPECEEMIARELTRVLSAYFDLRGGVRVTIERADVLHITMRADAVSAKPFGVLGG